MEQLNTVREATSADVSRLVYMARQLVKELSAPLGFDEAHAAAFFIDAIWGEDSVVFISNKGFISGRLAQTPYNPAPVAAETAWHAEAGGGMALYRAFEKWAESRSASIAATCKPGSRAQRLFKCMGYQEAELTMVKHGGL